MLGFISGAVIAGFIGYAIGKSNTKALADKKLKTVCKKLEEVSYDMGYYRGLCVNTVRLMGGNGGLLEMRENAEEFGTVYLQYICECVKEVIELKKGLNK